MSENLFIDKNTSKEDKYKQLVPQIEALIAPETNLIANLANVSSALKEVFNFWWVGFYLVENNELVLGPFQGPIACTRIPFEKGVCGACYTQGKTIIVPDVNQFPGHIACSSVTQSEIVIPIKSENKIVGVLDVDSELPNHFDNIDQQYLEKITSLIK